MGFVSTYWASVSSNLAGLGRFRGRQTRISFWPYAATVGVLSAVAAQAILIPELRDTMERMRAFAEAHPDQASIATTAHGTSISIRGLHPELMPDLGSLALPMAVLLAVTVALLAAAVVRRLHDAGRSAAWGVPPVILLVAGVMLMARLFALDAMDWRLFVGALLTNALYLASLLALVVMLAREGVPPPLPAMAPANGRVGA